MLDLSLKLLISKFNYLHNLLLGIKARSQRAFLCNFQELNIKMLFVNAAIAHTEFHE